ncbi:MAG: InlB B-repeat-containing protein, partial [Bacilli bacterium]|nr:InlB B-repeat-containing protein [Bacilli bacterium]
VINKTADTDTLVTAEINAYPGFTEYANHPNYLTSAEVLGDGSLVLKVYYKRNIYRITYLEDGGSKVSNQDVKFGADITSPISDKIGYEFNHWYLSNEAEPYVFATMPLQDLSLTAKWTKIIYKITFETNAEISVVSITATYEDVIQAPTPPIRLGYEFIDWYEAQDLKIPYAFTIMPAKNFTLYAKWGALPYTVEFETNGGSAIDPVTAPVGTVVEKPLPTKPGFDFVNWFQDPQFINECNELTIPVGGIKLYAKWNPKDYTIIFETNGGSSILPLTASYESAINEPVLPTKEGYFFEGWYSDADFTIPFSFTTMPLDGATVYVKWLDETAQNQIANVLRQETYSHVAVKGTVFAKNNSDFYGFYLLDRTGFIYIHADHNLVDIGDYIYLEGYLNPYALINGVSNLQIISSDSALYEPVMVSYEDLSEYYAINNNYKYLSITGILINEDGYYYLFNALTNDKIKLDHRLYQEEALGVYVNQYVLLNFTLIYNKNEVQLGVINIDNSVNTVDNQMMIVRQLLHNRPMIRMLPEVSFDLVNLNIFGWGELSFAATGANASLYDPVNNCFLPTDIAKTVEFDVEINLAGTIQSLPISIVVGPRISISEFLTLPPGIYHLQGIVVMNMESIWSILKDQSGTLIIDIQDYRQVRIGDELAITVEKYAETFDFFDYQVISYEILQRNLELNNSPRILSEEDVVALSQSLDFINGEYVQVRGYVGPYCDDMYDFFVEIAGHQYPIFIGNYSAYENINKYLDHEVQLRVYLLNDEGQMCFIFADTRGDMQIPVYSDQELVNYLQAAFTRTYAGKVFYPCDTFVYHNDPLYAASISWEMDRETAKYFNFRYNRFLYVDNAVDVNIDITITMNEASVTFRYHTTLEPKTTTAAEFKNLKAYEKVFIEGVVVYRHPKYIYLLTDDELIFVNMYDLDVYIGDRVILYGIKQIRNYYYGEPYLIYDNNSNIMTILKVISRDNSYNLVSVPLPVAEIYQLDPENPSSYTRYIEVSGTLIKKESNYYLTNGNQLLLIDYVDEYTMYNQLAPYLYTKVTLRGFISDYQYYDDLWSIRFLGRSGDIESRAYSDLEKVNLIKDYYFNAYNNLNIADSSIYLDTAHPDFGGTITYETFGDNASIINFSNNTVQPVEKITSVDVRATITFGEITDTLTFVINVIPADKPVTLITISEALNARPGDSVTFKGTIIGIIVQYSDSYFLIQDETGVIYLRTKNYFYNYNNVGRMIQATGKVE